MAKFTGYTEARINGYKIVEGTATFGGQWAAIKGSRVTICDSRADAEKYARVNPTEDELEMLATEIEVLQEDEGDVEAAVDAVMSDPAILVKEILALRARLADQGDPAYAQYKSGQ